MLYISVQFVLFSFFLGLRRHWSGQVGKGKSYTPAEEDIGAILKVEVTPIDKIGNPVETSSPFCLATARVRHMPVPPQRSMVPLPNVKHLSSTEGTFTVLTYNILADLYATVRMRRPRQNLAPSPFPDLASTFGTDCCNLLGVICLLLTQ